MTDPTERDYLLFSNAAYSNTASPIGGLNPAKFLRDENGDAFPLKIGDHKSEKFRGHNT